MSRHVTSCHSDVMSRHIQLDHTRRLVGELGHGVGDADTETRELTDDKDRHDSD